MNFNLTEEHIMIRDAARDFAQTELLPDVIERDNKQMFPHELVAVMGAGSRDPLTTIGIHIYRDN